MARNEARNIWVCKSMFNLDQDTKVALISFPQWKWEDVTIEFITKFVHFIPGKTTCSVVGLTHNFSKKMNGIYVIILNFSDIFVIYHYWIFY